MHIFFQKRIFPFFFIFLFGFSLFAQIQPDRNFYKEGIRRLQEKDYALAQSLLSEYIKNPPNPFFLPECYLGLGIAQLCLGQEKIAYTLFLELDRKFKNSFANSCGLFWRGVCCFNEKEYKKAIELLEEYLNFEFEKADIENSFLDLAEQRNRAFLYLMWSYYKDNQKDFAYKNGVRAMNEGTSPDFDFSFFSLFASLLRERGEIKFLSTILKSCDATKWSEREQLYCKLYQAEVQLLLQGEHSALPLFIEMVEPNDLDKIKFDSLFIYCYQRIFLIYESLKEYDIMAELALFFHQRAKENQLKKYAREWMLRCVAMYLQRRLPNEVLRFTDLLLQEDSFDCEAWYFRILARSQLEEDPQVVSFLEALPESVKNQLLALNDGEALPSGDLLLIQLAQELAEQKEWEKSVTSADSLLKNYPDSSFFLQALYLRSYGMAKKEYFQKALICLQEEQSYQSLQYLFKEAILNPCFDESSFKKEMNERREKGLISLFFLEAYLLRKTKKGGEALALYDFLLQYYQKKKIDFSRKRLFFLAGLTAFQQKDFKKIQQYQELLLKSESQLEEKDRLLLSYFEALSYIAQKEYRNALEVFDQMDFEDFKKNQMEEILPWFFYHKGWAYYGFGEYEKAEKEFDLILKEFPDFERKKEVCKLAGRSAFSSQHYHSAAAFFSEAVKDSVDEKESEENRLLQGRALILAGEIGEGQLLLKQLAESENSFWGDYAFMELAFSFYKEREFIKAGEIYLQLTQKFGKSGYAEKALFLAGESYFVGKEFLKAIEIYSLYQKQYPKRLNVEVVYYRKAFSLMQLNKMNEASFQFQQLLEKFPASPYEPQILIHLAEMAASQGKWEKASSWYRELQRRFSPEAKATNAAYKLNSLFYQQQEKSSKENELLILIQENGPARRRGREAALQLSDLYLTLYRSEENCKNAVVWLEAIASLSAEHPADAVQAVLLLAKEAKRTGEYEKAMDYYRKLLSWKPSKEMAAQFLFSAILCDLEAGGGEEALSLYSLLKKDYPQSKWLKKAEQLPEWQRLFRETFDE